MKAIYFNLFFILVVMTNSVLAQPNDSVPVHDTFTILSKSVGDLRTINIWIPEEYKTCSDFFQVLYMIDGGLKEDFPHIANTLADLIKAKKIKPIILVGIENTGRRRDLTGFTNVKKDKKIAAVVGGSEKFRAFINDELFPEINKRYRTTNKTGIIGESLAGLFVTETFLLKPDMFDFYIAFDPSLWWNNKYLVKTAQENLSKFPNSKKKFWFASSKDLSKSVRKLEAILKENSKKNIQFKYSDEPNEQHNTIFRSTKEKAIIWSLNEN